MSSKKKDDEPDSVTRRYCVEPEPFKKIIEEFENILEKKYDEETASFKYTVNFKRCQMTATYETLEDERVVYKGFLDVKSRKSEDIDRLESYLKRRTGLELKEIKPFDHSFLTSSLTSGVSGALPSNSE